MYKRCPASQLDSSAARVIAAWGDYQNGHLPDPGGTYDQSACFMHALKVLAAEKSAIDKIEGR